MNERKEWSGQESESFAGSWRKSTKYKGRECAFQSLEAAWASIQIKSVLKLNPRFDGPSWNQNVVSVWKCGSCN